jgi:UDP-3-O-[3-hydroxymyristoyl] glucosamine N-acyltransferase
MRLVDLAKDFGLSIHYEGKDLDVLEFQGLASLERAQPGDLTFFSNPSFQKYLKESRASALLVKQAVADFKGPQLIHKDPQFIYAKVLASLQKADHGPEGVHPAAFVHPTAQLGQRVRIHAGAHVEAEAKIGDDCVLYPGVYVGTRAQIGQGSLLYPNVVIYHDCVLGDFCLLHAGSVVGADGFGFAVSGGQIAKIPQVGIVRIGNHVELGAHCTIDRAAETETLIGNHCKFDDHVHIGHNCKIGDNTMLSAQVGIAGSTTIGKWVLMGGQSGVADHRTVADGIWIGAKTAVITDLTERGTYVGFPAIPQKEWLRQSVYLRRLKDNEKTIKDLQQRLLDLEKRMQ